jgi:signal transduction histidine kinase
MLQHTPPNDALNHRQSSVDSTGRQTRSSHVMIGLTIAVFAAAICLVTLHLRNEIRAQIITRDGEILYAVTLLQQYELAEDPLFTSFAESATQLEIVLKTSRLKGVIAARLFDRTGGFIAAFPPNAVKRIDLSDSQLNGLKKLVPTSKFQSAAHLANIFQDLPGDRATNRSAVLEVNIPLHAKDNRELLGAAQLIITGESIAQQFAALDRHLLWQAGVILLLGGGLVVFGLRRAFRRLETSNFLLSQRTHELLHANRELVLASKTSALGAITAHLVHGLKNPLFGLKNLTDQCVQEPCITSEREWRSAAAATDQMQTIINEVLRVLQDEQMLVECQISFHELMEIIEQRFGPAARLRDVRLVAHSCVEGAISHRTANLLVLILQNLIDNALHATPEGKHVRLSCSSTGAGVTCAVADEGNGIPLDQQKFLFAPCRTSKPQSSGIGLAISKQLANHLGASLELQQSTCSGSVFHLHLPADLVLSNDAAFAA